MFLMLRFIANEFPIFQWIKMPQNLFFYKIRKKNFNVIQFQLTISSLKCPFMPIQTTYSMYVCFVFFSILPSYFAFYFSSLSFSLFVEPAAIRQSVFCHLYFSLIFSCFFLFWWTRRRPFNEKKKATELLIPERMKIYEREKNINMSKDKEHREQSPFILFFFFDRNFLSVFSFFVFVIAFVLIPFFYECV